MARNEKLALFGRGKVQFLVVLPKELAKELDMARGCVMKKGNRSAPKCQGRSEFVRDALRRAIGNAKLGRLHKIIQTRREGETEVVEINPWPPEKRKRKQAATE